MARAADPADTPASIRVCVLSGEVTEMSKAAVLPVAQLVNRMDAKMVPMTCFSQDITKGVVSCHNITPTLTSDGMMSKGVKGLVRSKSALGSLGCVHTKPPLYGNLMDRCIKM